MAKMGIAGMERLLAGSEASVSKAAAKPCSTKVFSGREGKMARATGPASIGRALIALAVICAALPLGPRLLQADPGPNQQGWTPQQRQAFYTTDQGSRIIPINWFLALPRADGSGLFAADGLARYGYLSNPKSKTNPFGLPVGFMVAPDVAAYGGRATLAMNCAACHTREIIVNDQPMRIDGGPAIADFYGLLSDLESAMQVVVSGGEFDDFARRVLGSKNTPAAAAALKKDVEAWYAEYSPFIKAALPERTWGPARLDAFGMIFNRLSGIDLGQPSNIVKADAPVRYPFLWNASRQDKTQWNGAAKNGLFTLAMGRNLGQVYGVFGRLKLTENDPLPGWVNFAGRGNSANFHNLQQLETLISKLTPPRYPLPTDPALVKRGEALFASEQCSNCHLPVEGRFGTWKTPLTLESTDSRMYRNAQAKIKAIGLLDGVSVPQLIGSGPLTPSSGQIAVLSTTVANTLLEQLSRDPDGVLEAVLADLGTLTKPPARGMRPTAMLGPGVTRQTFLQSQVRDLYGQARPEQGGAAYEARVLYGIWAAAPYLHNGSVPNLWALLQKPEDRPKSFQLGSNKFDPKNVGLDTNASPFGYTYTAESCDNINDGNSNCGHVWGTKLSDEDKWALVEYMKQL
jgi:mono/diheme cytochrome c family protein